MAMHFKKVTIIGVGLIGGSLARVLKEKSLAEEIYGVGRNWKNLSKAKSLGLIDQYFHKPADAVGDSDLIILSTPIGAFINIIKDIGSQLKDGAIVTDVGSVKGDMVRKIEEALPGRVSFVGGHPISGKESAGADAASGDLFKGAKCILTPTGRTDRDALNVVKSIWEEAGSEVIFMDSHLHDRVFAAVSHLPHMIAYSLINTVARMEFQDADPFFLAGKGFKDLTRIASSPPGIWKDVCLYNKDNLLEAINSFEGALKVLKGYLEKQEEKGLIAEFEAARKIKETKEKEWRQ